MPPIKAVIFDLDGCLVDSEPLSLEAIAAEMRTLGIMDASAQEIGEKFLGVAMPVITHYASQRLGHPVPADFADRVEDRLLETYQTDLNRVFGAAEMLDSLQNQGASMAIATGGSLRRMATTLDLSKLGKWFFGTACSAEEVAAGKPAPDLFLLALERLKVEAAECIVVEDSPHGVKGAGDAGIPSVGFIGGSHLEGKRDAHASLLRDAGAIAVFEELRDLETFISARVQ